MNPEQSINKLYEEMSLEDVQIIEQATKLELMGRNLAQKLDRDLTYDEAMAFDKVRDLTLQEIEDNIDPDSIFLRTQARYEQVLGLPPQTKNRPNQVEPVTKELQN